LRTRRRAVAWGALLVAAALLTAPAGAEPMASGEDTRDPAHIPQFNFTKVEVRPGETGTVGVTVANRFAQTVYSLQLDLTFQVGGEWRHARPVTEIAEPPRFDNASVAPPPDLAAGESVTLRRSFTTSAGTPDGVYLVSLVVRFSYLDATNNTRGAVLKSLGAIAQEGDTPLVDMMNYSATLEALGIDGVAPDTSVVVDSNAGESLFWLAAGAGVAAVAVGYGVAEALGRRRPAGRPARRKRG